MAFFFFRHSPYQHRQRQAREKQQKKKSTGRKNGAAPPVYYAPFVLVSPWPTVRFFSVLFPASNVFFWTE
jgi:hypothetical protein